MAQCGAGKHDQWQGYMTVLIVNVGIVKLFSNIPADICLMIKFDVHKPPDCFRLEVMGTQALCLQLSTLSTLALGCIHDLPKALLQEQDTYCQLEGNR